MNDNSTTMIIDDPDVNGTPANMSPEQPSSDPVPRTPFVLLVRDVEWPGPGGMFEHLLPQPAIFQRAYRAEVHRKLINKRIPILRMVFLANADGPMQTIKFAVQAEMEAVSLSDTDDDPIKLDVVISPMGEPIMLWQLTRYMGARPAPAVASEEPAPPTE